MPGGQKVDSKMFNHITPYLVKLSMCTDGTEACSSRHVLLMSSGASSVAERLGAAAARAPFDAALQCDRATPTVGRPAV